MTDEERRKRPEHHIVHEYANLISAGTIRLQGKHLGVELPAPVNSHVWHAFYTHCRGMYEFFTRPPHKHYLRAVSFVAPNTEFTFKHWTSSVQTHIEGHLMHVGNDRPEGQIAWSGRDDIHYLADFRRAWELFLKRLKQEHRGIFREEIDNRLNSEFRHCGTLGREFIL